MQRPHTSTTVLCPWHFCFRHCLVSFDIDSKRSEPTNFLQISFHWHRLLPNLFINFDDRQWQFGLPHVLWYPGTRCFSGSDLLTYGSPWTKRKKSKRSALRWTVEKIVCVRETQGLIIPEENEKLEQCVPSRDLFKSVGEMSEIKMTPLTVLWNSGLICSTNNFNKNTLLEKCWIKRTST